MVFRSRTALVCVMGLVFLRAAAAVVASAGAPIVSVSISRTPAPVAGAPLTIEAGTGPGLEEPLEFQFWRWDAASGWLCVRPYGPDASYTWTPDGPGTVAVQVWVRRAGTGVVYEAWAGTGHFEVGAAAAEVPAQLEALTSDMVIPAAPGTTITWYADVAGDPQEAQYQFWLLESSGWRLAQAYGPSPHFTWKPAAAGMYAVQVWVRRPSCHHVYDDWRGTGTFEVEGGPPVARVTLTADTAFPLKAAQPITWTADAGGRADVEYQFWRFSNSHWSMVRDYTPAPAYSWTPGPGEAGVHALQVWARRAGSSAVYEAWTGTSLFDVSPPEPTCGPVPGPGGACFLPVSSYVDRDYLADLVVRSRGEVADRRRALIQWIWGTDTLPDRAVPAEGSHESGITHPQIDVLDLPNLARVDRYRIDVPIPALEDEPEVPLGSHIYEFVPVNSNNRLLVFNQGHIPDADAVFEPAASLGADAVLRQFLELGYTVIVTQLPLLGDNVDARFPASADRHPHELLGARQRAGFNPLKVFLEPVRTAIGYARSRRTYTDVSMLGVSGGGWLTTVYAAVDPVVLNSVQVAGTLPLTLNQGADDPCRQAWDWEQDQFPAGGGGQPLGYLDLYVLGSTADAGDGTRRQQIQILNRYDPCCFAGGKAENTYAEELQAFIDAIGGSYRLAIDRTHEDHRLSECALREHVLPALGHAAR